MKNFIIGTAGHIDHGKTSLIKALTGKNTDRLKEEQERKITIDLGFTYFDLDDNRIGIIDVPGHEKFINNMLSGVTGMDMVMLVVAADEGIMPQTKEHINILENLGIKNFLVVMNKIDMVDSEWLELMEEEIKEYLKTTSLKDSKIIRVSSKTLEGIEELKDELRYIIENNLEENMDYEKPFMYIDRVFTLKGFGTVVTGTLQGGSIKKEDELEIFPRNKFAKIRNLQVHSNNVDMAYPGQRVAINLSGIDKEDIDRGDTLAKKDLLKVTDQLDVRLNLLKTSRFKLEDNSKVHFFLGTKETIGRVALLDRKVLEPGQSTFAQIVLEDHIASKKGDMFVIRFFSPVETIGGGQVLDEKPPRHRRNDMDVIKKLEMIESGSTGQLIESLLEDEGLNLMETVEISSILKEDIDLIEEEISSIESIIGLNLRSKKYHILKKNLELAKEKILGGVANFHQKNPYKLGMTKSRIHKDILSSLSLSKTELYLEYLISEEFLKVENDLISLKEFQIEKDENFQKIETDLLDIFSKAGYDFINYKDIDLTYNKEDMDDILEYLIINNQLIRLGDNYYTDKKTIDKAIEMIKDKLLEDGLIGLGELRDMIGSGRKNARIIIDYTDNNRITKREGKESERVSF